MDISKNPEQLKGIFKLDHCIKLYIPGTNKIDKMADNSDIVRDTLVLFGNLFGGATSYQAKGAWLSPVRGLVVENITIVESYASREQVDKSLEEVLIFAKTIKTILAQEAVSLEYDNELYLV